MVCPLKSGLFLNINDSIVNLTILVGISFTHLSSFEVRSYFSNWKISELKVTISSLTIVGTDKTTYFPANELLLPL